MTIVALQKSHACRLGLPIIDRVDTRIFAARYFRDCMGCRFCADLCCSYGAQLDHANADRIRAEGPALSAKIGVDPANWFTEVASDDPAEPDMRILRTQIHEGRCVFLDRQGRGCKLHRYALEHDRPVNALKPMVCALFPVTYDYGLLRTSYEVNSGELICLGPGESAYAGARADLGDYFGAALLVELDALAQQYPTVPPAALEAAGAGDACNAEAPHR